MNRKHWWLVAVAVVVVALLVSACGPQMATPTPKTDVAAVSPTAPGATAPATAPVTNPTAVQPTVEPVNPAELPVDPNDWHALGPADAKVTIVEYSEFM